VTDDPAIRAIAVLDDDLRRGMYTFIRTAGRPVTRDEAAAAVGISRKLAAFHLDKLVDAGVLQAGYQPRPGVRKVGRAPKVYQPSSADLHVSIPPRHHDLLADILLAAVLAGDSRDAAPRVARERGHAIGAAERDRSRPGRLGAERALTLAAALLHRNGFEPDRTSPTCVRLHTCPFHPLAAKAPDVVCGINHAFLTGVVDGLAATSIRAVLDPGAGGCCVELSAAPQPRQ
jgi:predicted ArsR family transcriptional regulator